MSAISVGGPLVAAHQSDFRRRPAVGVLQRGRHDEVGLLREAAERARSESAELAIILQCPNVAAPMSTFAVWDPERLRAEMQLEATDHVTAMVDGFCDARGAGPQAARPPATKDAQPGDRSEQRAAENPDRV